jgi:hypothetical protein
VVDDNWFVVAVAGVILVGVVGVFVVDAWRQRRRR